MFRLLGFDVHVRPGFVVFLLLVIALYGDSFGIWLAGSLAVFTLLHELGHALAARRHGAVAAISLDFLAGYTSFRPSRPLGGAQRAMISVAGPATHIAAGIAVLMVMGVDPFSRSSIGQSDAAIAVWWAGPVIGAINLIPVLPLDGGHLAQTGLERIIGRRAQVVMIWLSLGASAAGAVWCLLDPSRRFFLIFVGFLFLTQISLLTGYRDERAGRQAGSGAGRRGRGRAVARQSAGAADAERSAWRSGRAGMLLPGQELSPWYRAHRELAGGRADEARRLLVDDLTASGRPMRWWPPDGATTEQLASLVNLLPRPLPSGNPISEHVLMEVLLRTGDAVTAGTYAADAFSRTRSPASALMVARAAGALGDDDMAVKWLRAAAETPAAGRAGLVEAIDSAPEFARLRSDPAVAQLRDALRLASS